MNQWRKVMLIATVVIFVSPCYSITALALNIQPGVILWETPASALSNYRFGGSPSCPSIPADFFGPGSDPFDGLIYFQGQPLPTIPPDVLGSTDTIIERLVEAELPQCGASDTIDIKIVALNLVSTEPITVTYFGGMTQELWDVQMCLSSSALQQTGFMAVNQECESGGTFTAELPVIPKFIFSKVDPPHSQMIWDFGDYPGAIVYQVPGFLHPGYWVYNDPESSLVTSLGGILVDHDCDGVQDMPINASSNFCPGLKARPCDCQSDLPNHTMQVTHWSYESCGDFRNLPSQDGIDSDGDVVIDVYDNCPSKPNALFNGTCISGPYQGQGCRNYSDCDGYNCSINQEDMYPPQGNGIGDACDCEADFNCDGNVDAADVTDFLTDFGRSTFFNPCTNIDPCNGDFNCDTNVDAADVTKFLEDFGRSSFFNPCPTCEVGDWCVYP